jgi:hypothetical protein
MAIITLNNDVVMEFELAAWEQTRVVDSLNRGEFAVLSSSGYWRASFDYQTDAIDFAQAGDSIISPKGSILSVVAIPRRIY